MDANGFVMFTGSPTPLTLTGNSGGPISAVANNFNILGASVAAAGVPVTTVGTAGTITVDIQRSSGQASSSAINAGLASFNSTYFTVDGNGFVTANGSGMGLTITGDSGGALSPTAGNWTWTGGTTGLTFSGAVSTLTLGGTLVLANGGTSASLTASNGGIFYSTASAGAILAGTATARQMLQSGASTTPAWSTSTWPATTTINQLLYSSSANTVAGLATTNSAVLTTTSGGVPAWVGPLTNGQLIIGSTGAQPVAHTLTAGTGITITNGAGSITIAADGSVVGETITGDSGGALSPSSGNWNIIGGTVAAGTSPLKTAGSGSTLTINVQKSQAIASADATKIGLCNFNNAQFTVDANGFVSLASTGAGLTITGTTGGALSPTANNWNIYGSAPVAGTTPVVTSGSGSTLTVNVQTSQAIASSNANNIGLAAFDSSLFTVDSNGFVSFGVIPIAHGGTNASSFGTTHGIVVYDGTRLVNYAGPQISTSGYMKNSTQPCFSAYMTSAVSNVTGDGTLYTVLFDTVRFDNDTNYATGTGLFTAPVAGNYLFTATIQVSTSSTWALSGSDIFITKNASTYLTNNNLLALAGDTTIDAGYSISIIVNLAANDTVKVQINCNTIANTKNTTILGVSNGSFSTFCGYLLPG